jgi:hypothetical protein
MVAKPVAFLLADLGVTKGHSRESLKAFADPPRQGGCSDLADLIQPTSTPRRSINAGAEI